MYDLAGWEYRGDQNSGWKTIQTEEKLIELMVFAGVPG